MPPGIASTSRTRLPTGGRAAPAEQLLDRHERNHPGTPTIARIRPAFIVHAEAASGLLRYFTPALTPARSLRARPVHLPYRVLRQLVHISWLLRLQPVSIGWVDLAFGAPLMHTTRARAELGWRPTVAADEALREVIDAIVAGRAGPSPPLRKRTLLDALAGLRRGGAVDVRRLP
ncbi:hypothetical protein [Dietzia massiliensis]|uniref:hypothetical protein n=1 Tax=Dietzia massiliensis TaxID=2697499 RepID=UPI001F369CCA|nr:hypothetical protein [Dietzia massiliensis]